MLAFLAAHGDPATWDYKKLHHYLTTATRETDPDPTFVANIRKCILPRSELIWERIKGALGVPPELDHDEEDAYRFVFVSAGISCLVRHTQHASNADVQRRRR